MKFEILKKTLLAASIVTAFGLAGCSADGSGTESGNIVSDGGAPLVPPLNNDGSTPTNVQHDTNNDGTADTPVASGKNFICTQGARAFGDVITAAAATGLVGGPVSALVTNLGGDPVPNLTNDVTETDLAVDGHLATYATVKLPVALLGPTRLVDSVGEAVIFPKAVPAGNYAVFGVTFPAGTLNLSLTRTVRVNTYLGNTLQESLSVQEAQLQLLAINVAGDKAGFIGIKTQKDFDIALVSIDALLLSADVGDAMRVNELCTGGNFVTPKTP